MTGVRRAIVIGINTYEKEGLPELKGAVNDAREVREILRSDDNFLIPEEHFLTDDSATSDNIRRAISDLLWKTEACDIALFFFAGHGKRDHLSNGYLMPYDADPKVPFVKGVRIQELKHLFLNSQLKKTGILVLDCCYSGIATGLRAAGDDAEEVTKFHEEWQPTISEKTRLESIGDGRYILASADADKKAREVVKAHAFSGEEHVHGAFSFHLIEGLRAGGLKDQFGRVHLQDLIDHLTKAFEAEEQGSKSRPQFWGAGSLGKVPLVIAQAELRAALDTRIAEIRDFLCRAPNEPTDMLVAIAALRQLEDQRVFCPAMDQCWADISDLIENSRVSVGQWWAANRLRIRQTTRATPSWEIIERLARNFTVQSIRDLDDTGLTLLDYLIGAIKEADGPSKLANTIRLLDRDRDARIVTSETTSPSAKNLLAGPPS